MIVQSINTGGDLGDNHFDLQIPGGGLHITIWGHPRCPIRRHLQPVRVRGHADQVAGGMLLALRLV
jgi:hypothetical protein